ncbi:MAG: 2,3,4,5-tetrahydropyridine-2,6-dicarboxylate N-succinyltransferase [Gammaproteobacteria bacterium RIFCSPLOWO2_02_FULL_42_14]|nr:MAG: 2,3,4,5-tetrahydropyridine-2,6-dicarboxylate N-succinyltransferase [Gammaproteobacteria bacterium RIFCSPHIGHO2_02_FULL_42_43]OGT50983.1 MAG: 2,3,4,5-tetrahydropyridine-2,6-dicarboxylate N-succinyltransferase [Gammaproteobacteria bacterium RIFCSPHIGHO2_12_FULL_41_25]OGT63043.1 MAG: 2,3,4,5-tetrahydropyridine-2,6-dicarboxylate N-succinyltransferase [Gammaproteobacteria bacterium RIFCSPLOWO2_02_FULL_42_14]OGT85664.1 MAG: 2,3,4,5-tetrahydropyridine-2,6-dicarboxylate N-succinyltransferase [Ga
MKSTQHIIDSAFDQHHMLTCTNASVELRNAVHDTIALLDQGKIRVAEKINGAWTTHEWIKKAILLFFKITDNQIIPAEFTNFYDKVPLKFSNTTAEEFNATKIRVVPNAVVRRGAFLASNTIVMPSFINIGAFIDSGTLIDTWSTIGSCAQIGKNVHISGGVGIGGVLEPLQSAPTIIEDNCFIGARSEIVEGVVVEANSVISMGVFIGKSTPIYNRMTDEIIVGKIPAGSVVISGSLPADNGKYARSAAIIVKQVDEKTRSKTSINELLRC